MKKTQELKSLSDDELLRRLSDVLAQSRRVESVLVAHIAEVDARRLFAREASPSMFQYCIDELHLSKAEAYLRIAAARASREYPVLLTMVEDGRLHLSGICVLAPHLTKANCDELLLEPFTRPRTRSKNWWPRLRRSRMSRRWFASWCRGKRSSCHKRRPSLVQTEPVQTASERIVRPLRQLLLRKHLRSWRSSSRWPPRVIKFSSRRAPSFVTKSSGSPRSCLA